MRVSVSVRDRGPGHFYEPERRKRNATQSTRTAAATARDLPRWDSTFLPQRAGPLVRISRHRASRDHDPVKLRHAQALPAVSAGSVLSSRVFAPSSTARRRSIALLLDLFIDGRKRGRESCFTLKEGDRVNENACILLPRVQPAL